MLIGHAFGGDATASQSGREPVVARPYTNPRFAVAATDPLLPSSAQLRDARPFARAPGSTTARRPPRRRPSDHPRAATPSPPRAIGGRPGCAPPAAPGASCVPSTRLRRPVHVVHRRPRGSPTRVRQGFAAGRVHRRPPRDSPRRSPLMPTRLTSRIPCPARIRRRRESTEDLREIRPDHGPRCDAPFTSRVRGRRRHAHRVPPDILPQSDDAFTSWVRWSSRMAFPPPPAEALGRRRGCDAAFTLHRRGHQDLLNARLRDRLQDHLRTIPRPRIGAIHQASTRRPRFDPRDPLREHQEARDPESKNGGRAVHVVRRRPSGSAHSPPPGHPRDHPTACDDSPLSRLRGFLRIAHGPPPGPPRPMLADAPPRSRRMSIAVEELLTVRLREVPRPSPPTRRLVHVACPWPSTTYSPSASRTSSRRPSRTSSLGSDDTPHRGSGGHRRMDFPPPPEKPRDHRPGYDAAFTLHLPWPSRLAHRRPPGPSSGPSAACCRRHPPDITATPSVWIRATPSRASGSSRPGVEDGGQDKGVVPCG